VLDFLKRSKTLSFRWAVGDGHDGRRSGFLGRRAGEHVFSLVSRDARVGPLDGDGSSLSSESRLVNIASIA
jgi:hypothetical protein